MLVGYTEQGVQRFQCHRSLHTCVPGRAILIEPGVLHDGHAPEAGGFTYAMCTCRKTGLSMRRAKLNIPGLRGVEEAFSHTLVDERYVVAVIQAAFLAI